MMYCPHHPNNVCDRLAQTSHINAITCTKCGLMIPSLSFDDGIARPVEYTCECGHVQMSYPSINVVTI